MSSLDAVIEIAKGSVFSEANIIKTFTTALTSNVETRILWDGKNKDGQLAPSGVYTARLKVTDGLNSEAKTHTSEATAQVTVSEWFKGDALDSNLAGAQQYPEISGTRVVWQDQRNGNWDIYTKDMSGGASMNVTNNPSDQTRPSISGNIIVWQDQRNGKLGHIRL